MSETIGLIEPGQAREVLGGFVERAEGAPVVRNYEQLQEIVGPEVGLALASLIIYTGLSPRHRLTDYGPIVLEKRKGLTLVQGIVGSYRDSKVPKIINLEQYRRRLGFGYRRTQWSQVDIDGVGRGAVAGEGREMYYPYSASSEFIDFWGNEVGTTRMEGSTRKQTGLDIAVEAVENSHDALNGYLHTTARLTKGLVELKPAS